VVTAAAIPLGLAIGVALGMLGGGGSVLAVPVLVYALGQGVHEATTASLVIVATGALAGGLRHARARRVCWGHAAAFVAGALPGAAGGTALGDAVGGGTLLVAFAGLMLAVAAATWRRGGGRRPPEGDSPPPGCPGLRLAHAIAAGALVGVLTGLFGVGGGFLIVPMLALALAFSMRLAVGTSLVIIAGTSVTGLIAHMVAGRGLDVALTGTMTAACLAGALGGAALAGRVPQRALARGFAGLVAVVAASLLVSAGFLGGPPGGA